MAGIDDKELEKVVYSPLCTFCENLDLKKRQTCTAFPSGIPKVIWDGEFDHRSAYPGDKGIRFKPIPNE